MRIVIRVFIEKALADLKMLSDEAGVSIKRDFKESSDIDVDANLTQGVFTNLLKNAIEHIQDCEHENEKVVTVALYPHKGKTIATLNNKGEIIPPDKLKVFFEKFNTDRTKKKEGSGFGTTYAYLITKAHGGDIFVESNEDDGTTVTVIIDLTETCFSCCRSF